MKCHVCYKKISEGDEVIAWGDIGGGVYCEECHKKYKTIKSKKLKNDR